MNLNEARAHVEWRIRRGDYASVGITAAPDEGEHELPDGHAFGHMTFALDSEPFSDVMAGAVLDAAGRPSVVAVVGSDDGVPTIALYAVRLGKEGLQYEVALLDPDRQTPVGAYEVSSLDTLGAVTALVAGPR